MYNCRYVYTGKFVFDENLAESLLYAAEKYMIDDLFNSCINYYMETMTTENACIILDQACLYDIPRLKKQCLRFICDKAKGCFSSDSFNDLSYPTLDLITACEDLYLEEEKVYSAVIRWSDYECLRKDIEPSDENRRKVIGKVLYNIHFPVISKDFFHKELLNSCILSNEEKQFVINFSNVSEKDQCEEALFQSSDRKFRPIEYEKFFRFRGHFAYDLFKPSGSTEAVTFKVSNPMWLHGILLYGDFKTEIDNWPVIVNIDIRDPDDASFIFTKNCKIIENGDGSNDVMLHRPIRLQPLEYKIVVSMQGPFVSWGGTMGNTNITFHSCEISFQKCENPETNTGIDHGQIPGLLLSLL